MLILNKIVLSLLFFVKICPTVMLMEDESYLKYLNLSDDKKTDSYDNKNSLDDFTFVWSNRTRNKRDDSQTVLVDCLGFGMRIARILAKIFKYEAVGSEALKVKFYMSSTKSKHRSIVTLGRQFDLDSVDFVPERKTIVMVHGFLSHGAEYWMLDMENAFLRWDDVNVISVDWSDAGNTLNYYKAAINTDTVGTQIALLLESIVSVTESRRKQNKIVWGPLHLVGHSLGAHICGFAAKKLKKKKLRWSVKRITGLDPAQPCFRNAHQSLKLHKTDAPFVDVIHTNGRFHSGIGLGLPVAMGHVDFYPNGGELQPGCYFKIPWFLRWIMKNWLSLHWQPAVIEDAIQAICSHGRAHQYMIESIISAVARNCSFWAPHWDRKQKSLKHITRESCFMDVCTEMGVNSINYPGVGTFYVRTSNHAPYCIIDFKRKNKFNFRKLLNIL